MRHPAAAPPDGPPAAAATILDARGLTKRFGRRVALRDVSVAARPGELVAVIGPNGAGKTTLLSILAGALSADAGTVDRAPGEVGWVPQQAALYGKLSVAENLRLFGRLEGCPDVDAAVERMLSQAGLRDRAADQVGELSGGNRQRVNIAIGLLSEPDVLLLDEPSAGLDPRQRERLWEFVHALADRGTTVVYSTHDAHEAELHAGRVVLLADGELLFTGPPAALEEEVGAAGLGLEAAFVAFLRRSGN